jgi:hypothetical protein
MLYFILKFFNIYLLFPNNGPNIGLACIKDDYKIIYYDIILNLSPTIKFLCQTHLLQV